MKNMLNFKNFSAEELQKILDLALDMKKNPEKYSHALEGKKLYTLFEKTSTRTRCSFEVAAHDLGMHVTYLDPSGSQIGKKESIPDTAIGSANVYPCTSSNSESGMEYETGKCIPVT